MGGGKFAAFRKAKRKLALTAHVTPSAHTQLSLSMEKLDPPRSENINSKKLSWRQAREAERLRPVPSFESMTSLRGSLISDDQKSIELGPHMLDGDTVKVIYRHKRVYDHKGDEYQVRSIKLPYIFHLIYLMGPYWEWAMMAQICGSFAFISYSLVFAPYIDQVYFAIWCLDLIYAIDTLLRLIVEIWRHEDGCPCIIYLLPYTLTQFILDVASLIPIEAFYSLRANQSSLDFLSDYDDFRYNRLLRFSRAFKFTTVVVDERRVSAQLMFIIKYLVIYVVFLQFIACVLYYLLPATAIDFLMMRKTVELTHSWIRTVGREKPLLGTSHFDHFSICISFAAAVLTTTGYGDFSGTTAQEMAVLVVVQLVGAIVINGFFYSGLVTFVLEHDGARFDLFFRLDAILNQLVRLKAHPIYMDRVIEYYKLLWNYREGVHDVTFVQELPVSFVEDMYYDICSEMFHKTPLFRGLDDTFLREISRISHVVIYNPKMILCTTGGYALNLFYLIQGEVVVQSKKDSRHKAAILRAGCVFGDINLLFSNPYSTDIETLTCCQILQIKKFELFELFERRRDILESLRHRVEKRLKYAHEAYELIGTEPICWVEKRDKNPKNIQNPEFPVVIRSGFGWNPIIDHDVIDDSLDTMIVDMPCLDKSLEKKHTLVYTTCMIPPISEATGFIRVWNMFVMICTIYSGITAPYCLYFNLPNETVIFICSLDRYLEILLCVMYFLDLVVNIISSCPVSGRYFRLRDGLDLKLGDGEFWVDIAAVLLFLSSTGVKTVPDEIALIIRVVRLYKVNRYFNYLDNVYPNSIFILRVARSVITIIFAIHVAACYLFQLACQIKPNNAASDLVCVQSTWIRSFTEGQTDYEAMTRHDALAKSDGYFLAFYFATASTTGAGFGDFNPQNRFEMMFLTALQLFSFCIPAYFTAILTSALSCNVRPRLVFQEKLRGVKQFLTHKGLSEYLQKRVVEHYHLQDQLWNGVNLPEEINMLMFDAPEHLQEDAIYLEVELHFDGVPIFTKTDPSILVEITKLMRRYIIPPGTIFTRKGEVRRQMYVIGRGSVAVMSDQDKTLPLMIIDETGHFGIRDLLFGEPAHHDIRTLTYCLLYEVELRDLQEAFRHDAELLHRVEREKEFLQAGIDAMINEYSYQSNPVPSRPAKEVPSFIEFPVDQNDSTLYSTYEEYEEIFYALSTPAMAKFARCTLMKRTIHPVGTFAKIWICLMSLRAAFLILFLFEHTFSGRKRDWFVAVCDFFAWIDIYVKFHWAYYNKRNVLVSHPIKTCGHYIWKGDFICDVLTAIPYELIVEPLINFQLETPRMTAWYIKFEWIRLGQIIQIPAAIVIIHSTFKMRNFLLLVSYVTMLTFVCTTIACWVESIACPPGQALFITGDHNRLPLCKEGTFMRTKESAGIESQIQRWLIGVYYITQTVLNVGYGDMTTLSVREMRILSAVAIIGFSVVRCILADVTAAEVDIDETRHRFHEKVRCLDLLMSREAIPKKFRNYVKQYMLHNWNLSKGLQPRQLFRNLHPALESELFRHLVGDELQRVPIFRGCRENVLRSVCQVMNTLFFRKGDRICRYGSMHRELFVIVAGKVWIADKRLNWIATLQRGESFGECSVLSGTRRNYNAIAASNMELFVLSMNDFQVVLQRYPTVLDEMKSRLPNANMDIFQERLSLGETPAVDEDPKSISKQIKVLLERYVIPDHDEENILRKYRDSTMLRILGATFGFGNEDQDLPFFYFTRSTDASCILLIHPECPFSVYFNSCFVMLSYLSPLLSSYKICFSEEIATDVGNAVDLLIMLIEIPMWIHIVLQFFTPYVEFDGTYCRDWFKIIYIYGTKLRGFPMDFVSSLPIPLLTKWPYWGCIRFLRLVNYYDHHLSKADDLATSVIRYKVTLSMSTFGLTIHVLACIFYYFAQCNCANVYGEMNKDKCTDDDIFYMCPEKTWTYEYLSVHEIREIDRLVPWKWYIRSTYWVVATMTTSGFGDIVPKNSHETGVAIFTMFCGAFVLSVILSSFSAGISSQNKSHREYSYQVNILLKCFGNMGMGNERLDETSSYFAMRWDRCRGKKYHESTNVLPFSTNTALCYLLYEPIARKNQLFKTNLGATFMRQLCVLFQHNSYIPGINVVNNGYLENIEDPEEGKSNPTGTMFLISKGRVSSYGKDANGSDVLVRRYDVGEIFAQYSVFFYDMPFQEDYRAETYVEILSLTQPQVIELTEQFPEFAENVKDTIVNQYSYIKRYTIFDDIGFGHGINSPLHVHKSSSSSDEVNLEDNTEKLAGDFESLEPTQSKL